MILPNDAPPCSAGNTGVPLARRIEHTLLRADARQGDIERLCAEAVRHGFQGVCVNPVWVALAKDRLEGTPVRVVTVAGFPLGACDPDTKRFETEAAVDAGADEVDMVLQVGWALDGLWDRVHREIRDVVEAADERPVKVILETGLLTADDIRRAAACVAEAGAEFVKTCTGFGPRGVTLEDIRLIHGVVGGRCGIKASAGIRDRSFAEELIAAGADRLGTSSGPALVADDVGGV